MCPQTPKFCIRASNEIKVTEDVFWLLSYEDNGVRVES